MIDTAASRVLSSRFTMVLATRSAGVVCCGHERLGTCIVAALVSRDPHDEEICHVDKARAHLQPFRETARFFLFSPTIELSFFFVLAYKRAFTRVKTIHVKCGLYDSVCGLLCGQSPKYEAIP